VAKRAQEFGGDRAAYYNELSALRLGWGGRYRTSEWRNQNPMN
jgi:hypothetical protein